MKLRSRSGQSTVEYMLLISVVVIAIVAAAYVFVPKFGEGVGLVGDDVSETLEHGHIRLEGGS